MQWYWVYTSTRKFKVKARSQREALDIVKWNLAQAFYKASPEAARALASARHIIRPRHGLRPSAAREFAEMVKMQSGLTKAMLQALGICEKSLYHQNIGGPISKKQLDLWTQGKLNYVVLDAAEETALCGELKGKFEASASRELLESLKDKLKFGLFERLTREPGFNREDDDDEPELELALVPTGHAGAESSQNTGKPARSRQPARASRETIASYFEKTSAHIAEYVSLVIAEVQSAKKKARAAVAARLLISAMSLHQSIASVLAVLNGGPDANDAIMQFVSGGREPACTVASQYFRIVARRLNGILSSVDTLLKQKKPSTGDTVAGELALHAERICQDNVLLCQEAFFQALHSDKPDTALLLALRIASDAATLAAQANLTMPAPQLLAKPSARQVLLAHMLMADVPSALEAWATCAAVAAARFTPQPRKLKQSAGRCTSGGGIGPRTGSLNLRKRRLTPACTRPMQGGMQTHVHGKQRYPLRYQKPRVRSSS